MSDKKIEEVTPDTNVTGVELLPVSDQGTAKCMSVEQVKNFVLAKINAIAAASDITLATDGFFIKQGGSIKPIAANTLVQAVLSTVFGSTAASSIGSSDVIVIGQSDGAGGTVAKSTTFSAFASAVTSTISGIAMDIHGLTEEDEINDLDELPFYDNSAEGNRKISYEDLLERIIVTILNKTEETATSIDLDHEDLVYAQTYTIEEQSFAGTRIGRLSPRALLAYAGNVNGPSANTDGKIPQWNGANSKTLKDGLSLVVPSESASGITSGSSTTELPSAATVYQYGQEVKTATKAEVVNGPNTATGNNIAGFNGTTGKLIKDLGVAVATSVGSPTSDARILTEKAVMDAIEDAIEDAITTALASGGSIATAISNAIAAHVSQYHAG